MTRQGWECPKCGSVWAPHIGGCNNCNLQVGKADREKEKALQNQFIQRLNKAEKEEVERQARALDEQVDPYGPGRLAPNAYVSGRHNWNGPKATSMLYPPGTK